MVFNAIHVHRGNAKNENIVIYVYMIFSCKYFVMLFVSIPCTLNINKEEHNSVENKSLSSEGKQING